MTARGFLDPGGEEGNTHPEFALPCLSCAPKSLGFLPATPAPQQHDPLAIPPPTPQLRIQTS